MNQRYIASNTNVMNMYEVVPERIRFAMDMRGMKEFELANKINLSRSAVSNYCAGIRSPDIQTLYLISRALNVSMNYLFGMESLESIISDMEFFL